MLFRSKINLDEWGNLGMLVGSKQEINFTGKKLDTETGFYYFNQRFYDPEIGRFISEDPAHQGVNPYVYCGNSPLVYTDEDGRFWWLVGMAIASWDWQHGCFKDFSKSQTWIDIAFGAGIGYMADIALASDIIGTIRFGLYQPNLANSGLDLFAGITQTAKGIGVEANLLAEGLSVMGIGAMMIETPLFKEQHGSGLGL